MDFLSLKSERSIFCFVCDFTALVPCARRGVAQVYRWGSNWSRSFHHPAGDCCVPRLYIVHEQRNTRSVYMLYALLWAPHLGLGALTGNILSFLIRLCACVSRALGQSSVGSTFLRQSSMNRVEWESSGLTMGNGSPLVDPWSICSPTHKKE